MTDDDPIYLATGDDSVVAVWSQPDDAIAIFAHNALLNRTEIVRLIHILQQHISRPDDSIHTLRVDEEGWLMQHPASCGWMGIENCPYNRASARIPLGQFPPGRYRAGLNDYGEITGILLGDFT